MNIFWLLQGCFPPSLTTFLNLLFLKIKIKRYLRSSLSVHSNFKRCVVEHKNNSLLIVWLLCCVGFLSDCLTQPQGCAIKSQQIAPRTR